MRVSYSAAFQDHSWAVMQENVAVRSWHLLGCALPTDQPGRHFIPHAQYGLQWEYNQYSCTDILHLFPFFFPSFPFFQPERKVSPGKGEALCIHFALSAPNKRVSVLQEGRRSAAPSLLPPLMFPRSDWNINMFTEHRGKSTLPRVKIWF